MIDITIAGSANELSITEKEMQAYLVAYVLDKVSGTKDEIVVENLKIVLMDDAKSYKLIEILHKLFLSKAGKEYVYLFFQKQIAYKIIFMLLCIGFIFFIMITSWGTMAFIHLSEIGIAYAVFDSIRYMIKLQRCKAYFKLQQ